MNQAIYNILSELKAIVETAEETDAWEVAYDSIFVIRGNIKERLDHMQVEPIGYYNPDESYETDVRAYWRAYQSTFEFYQKLMTKVGTTE